MKSRQNRRRAGWVVALTALGAIFATQGLTASNLVGGSKAGDGSGVISGYDVSSIHYGLNGTDPSKIDSVTFTLDIAPAAGSTIKIQLSSTGSWFSCTNVLSSVTCATTALPQPTVAAATSLRVVVAQ